MVSRIFGLTCAVLAVSLASAAAKSIRFQTTLFGHDIMISEEDGGQKELLIDRKSILEDSTVELKEIALVGGSGVAIGYSGSGGNACDVSYFVLAFPKGQPVRIDGPRGNCSDINYEVGETTIRFRTDATPSRNGESWDWTLNDGFSEKSFVAFHPNTVADPWIDLRSRKISHPSDLFKYPSIASQIDTLLGTDRSSVLPIITGVGSIEFKGDIVLAVSCAPHQCGDAESFIAIDPVRKTIFAAWRMPKNPVVVRPKISKWSPDARSELAAWARRWTQR